MAKYQVTIYFELTDELMGLVPAHRTYINELIDKHVVDLYAVSMETQRAWITINAENKKEIVKILAKSPLHKFWTYEVDDLYVLDGRHYRLPEVQWN
jgi:frataxin-like iron-binding protein CyaY